MSSGSTVEDTVNPYIAMSDLAVNLVLILTFFFAASNAVGRAGWEKRKYEDYKRSFLKQVNSQLSPEDRPTEDRSRNDPPGVQRWRYGHGTLFEANTAELTQEGKRSLVVFAGVLRANKSLWRRVRIEGHTIPPPADGIDDWGLSAQRAASVARVLNASGHIPSYYMAVAGRAGQAPLPDISRNDSRHERIEIVIEYSLKAPGGSALVSRTSCSLVEKRQFIHAAKTGDRKHLLQLLSRNSSIVNSRDSSGTTALHWAVTRADLPVVRMLLANNANVNCTKVDGITPLHIAAVNGNAGMLRMLISSGGNVNARDDKGRTPLVVAQQSGNNALVDLLRQCGGTR